jgi:uncharacterized protein YukE
MFALIAMLTRRGPVLRALAAAAFIGAAACHDANSPLSPTHVGDVPVAGLPKDGDASVAGPTEDLEAPVIKSEAPAWGPGAPDVGMRAAQVGKRSVGALSCSQPQEEGSWENKAPSHEQFLTRINLRFVCQDQILNGQPYPSGSPWYVHAFRKGNPTDQDWGEVPAWRVEYGSAEGWIHAYYDQSHHYNKKHRHVYLKTAAYHPYDLEVWTYTDFEDLNQDDYWTHEWFAKTGAPDLIVESLTHTPANPTMADLITFTAVVKNVGNTRAGASQMQFVLGGDPNVYVQPPTFGVPELAPGQAYTVERQLQVSAAGTYSIDATADVRNAVAESNEGNNVRTGDYTVTPPPAGAPPVIRRHYALSNFGARIEWVPPQGATGFNVYRVGPDGQEHRLTTQPISGEACFSRLGEEPTNKCFTDLILVSGSTYVYWVAAKYSNKSDGLSERVSVTIPYTLWTADQVAQLFKDLGYAVEQAAQMLKQLGYQINDIARALGSVFQQKAEEVAGTLKAIGYKAVETAQALVAVFGCNGKGGRVQLPGPEVCQTAETVARILKNIGYAINDIASVLQSVYQRTVDQAAQILKNIDYPIKDIASVLQSVFHQNANQVANTLKALDYSARQVGQALKDIGGTIKQVVNAMGSAFSLNTLEELYKTLKGIFTCEDLAKAIGVNSAACKLF